MSGKLPSQAYFDIAAKKIDAEVWRQKLKLKHFELKRTFFEKYPLIVKEEAFKKLLFNGRIIN